MDITWYGHNCFRILERGQAAIVMDPYNDGLGLPVSSKLKGDVVTVSHDHDAVNNVDAVKGHSYVLAGPGEYEIGGVFIYGIAMHTVTPDYADYNVAYALQTSGLTVVHLGSLSHVPDQSTIEALGEVNAVLVPVGGGRGLTANQAAEVIALIEPNYIVPMDYAIPGLSIERDPLDKFLQAMGVSKVQEDEMLRVTSSSLPEQPQVIVLAPQE